MMIKDKLDIKDELLKVQDPILQQINKKFVSLSPVDKKIYVGHFKAVFFKLIELMQEADELFKRLYQRESYTGSYPDKLKVGTPEEFDMNLVMKLPSVSQQEMKLEESDEPGFIKVNMKEVLKKVETYNHWDMFLSKRIKQWIDDDGYLLQNKFREWMEGVLDKTLNKLPRTWDGMKQLEIQGEIYKVQSAKQGPALKVSVIMTTANLEFDMDLVPAFAFKHPSWPHHTRPLEDHAQKDTWYIIPKPKDPYLSPENCRKWRTSFQDQEGELLNGSGIVKPVIRLLKKLRDRAGITSRHLSSYAIKTVVMWEMEKQRGTNFWNQRPSYLFVHMLGRVVEHVKCGSIPNYWDSGNNLIDLNQNYISVCGSLVKIFNDILSKMAHDKLIIAKKLLTQSELSKLQESLESECTVEGEGWEILKKEEGLESLLEASGGSSVVDSCRSSSSGFLTGCALLAAGAFMFAAVRLRQNQNQ